MVMISWLTVMMFNITCLVDVMVLTSTSSTAILVGTLSIGGITTTYTYMYVGISLLMAVV